MFFLSNSAASQTVAAMAAMKRADEKMGESLPEKGTRRSPSKRFHTPEEPIPIPGVRPILKRDDTSTTTHTESDISVSFSTLEVFEFPTCLGDHPYCEGPPLGITGDCLKSTLIEVDGFERARRNKRRQRRDLTLSPSQRSHILLQLGYSVEEVADAALRTQKARMERSQSLQNRHWDSFNDIGERVARSFRFRIGGGAGGDPSPPKRVSKMSKAAKTREESF
eukprot:Nitzschia sp. Nitz4//scaffold111_size72815//26860//27614//NITZ4_005786-RA/size72815-snap-gene-0.98-mRNA-1//1//CDS//3329533168//8833//frame0